MPNRNKRRGVAAEAALRDKLTGDGLPARRVYASGAGKLYSPELEGDLRIETSLGELRGEVKMREDGWAGLRKWLGENHILFLKSPYKEPLCVLPYSLFVSAFRPAPSSNDTGETPSPTG